ncbi:MAG: TatD family hydrolase [Crenarchaeota archaeon]|nr:TatD family hydrolase [Thermoproteota archaeon]
MIRERSFKNIVDSHCHLHEFPDITIDKIAREFTVIAVSDDYPSSVKTIELAEKYDSVIPCVGVHPWMVDKIDRDEVEKIEKIVEKAMCIGEVGLDTKFVPDTIDRQREIFHHMLRIAREYSLPVNLHCAGTWREVYELVLKYDIDRANFHWYTGPLDLVDDIVEKGFFISINPAVKIQKKHQEVVKKLPLENMLLESDGPYEYRGIRMEPFLIRETVEIVGKIKSIEPSKIVEVCRENARRFLKI